MMWGRLTRGNGRWVDDTFACSTTWRITVTRPANRPGANDRDPRGRRDNAAIEPPAPGYRSTMGLAVTTEDASAADVRSVLEVHLAFARAVTPPDHVHALGVDDLVDSGATVFGARLDGDLVAVCALRELDREHGELKSMHTLTTARGRGAGTALVDHVLQVGRSRGYHRVSLETGTYDAFAPARALYERAGFARCEPYGEHTDNPFSVCMTIEL